MEKKKAAGCTIVLSIAIVILLGCTCLIKGANGKSLFNVITALITGNWLGEAMYDFYSYLIRRKGVTANGKQMDINRRAEK